MAGVQMRGALSAPGLLREVRKCFERIPDPVAGRKRVFALLARVRREHPHLKLLVVEDALASNGPHIRLLRSLDMRFVLGVKPGDHAHLFAWVDATPGTRIFEKTDAAGVVRQYRYLNGAPLNDANFDLEVNFLECRETRPGKRTQCFSRVTEEPAP